MCVPLPGKPSILAFRFLGPVSSTSGKRKPANPDVKRVFDSENINYSPSEFGKVLMDKIVAAGNATKPLDEMFFNSAPAVTPPTTAAYEAFATAIGSAGERSETKYQAEVMNPAMEVLEAALGYTGLVVKSTMSKAYLVSPIVCEA